MRGLQHGVGFADTSRVAKEDSERSPLGLGLFGFHLSKQRIGIGATFGHGADLSLWRSFDRVTRSAAAR